MLYGKKRVKKLIYRRAKKIKKGEVAMAAAEAKEVLIAPEKHICKCAYIINVSSDKSFVVADLIDEDTKKRFKAKGKNTIPPYVAPMLTVEVTGVWEEYIASSVAW